MARGQKCPSCGKLTFQPEGPVRHCKGCRVTGWQGSGPDKVAGRGKKCLSCEAAAMKQVAVTEEGSKIHYCSACGTVYFGAPAAN